MNCNGFCVNQRLICENQRELFVLKFMNQLFAFLSLAVKLFFEEDSNLIPINKKNPQNHITFSILTD